MKTEKTYCVKYDMFFGGFGVLQKASLSKEEADGLCEELNMEGDEYVNYYVVEEGLS